MKKFTCIVCPVSCILSVDEKDNEVQVNGNQCKRGRVFGVNEYNDPKRMITTTVKIENAKIKRLPVISTDEIPKSRLIELAKELYKITVDTPVLRGDIIVKNIGETGVDIIATRTII